MSNTAELVVQAVVGFGGVALGALLTRYQTRADRQRQKEQQLLDLYVQAADAMLLMSTDVFAEDDVHTIRRLFLLLRTHAPKNIAKAFQDIMEARANVVFSEELSQVDYSAMLEPGNRLRQLIDAEMKRIHATDALGGIDVLRQFLDKVESERRDR